MSTFLDHAPLIALIFFFAAFVAIALRTYRPGARKTLQSHAFIPLQEDEHHG